jgi:hypothetical protein
MSSPLNKDTISNVNLTLDQLLTVIGQLDEPALNQVAQVVAKSQREAKMARWLDEMGSRYPFSKDARNTDREAEIRTALQLSG